MANAKDIIADWSQTALTVYCIVRREADDFRLDDSDGSFGAAPADPYLSLEEDSVIKGRYEVAESRTAWNDGLYTVAVYRQAGGASAPVSDTIIGTGKLYIQNDLETELDASLNFVQKWILNRLVITDTEIILYDDDSLTVLKTWAWAALSKTRSKAT